MWNVDETGISNVKIFPKVLPTKGIYQAGKMSSCERSRSSTVIGAMNASGNYIPLFFVFARVYNLDALMINAPCGFGCAGTKNGWSDDMIFRKWLRYFNNVAKPSIEIPHILNLDVQQSHKNHDVV